MPEYITNNVDETILIGEKIGKKLDKKAFVALFGDLGVGKTQFAKGLAKGLGLDDFVSSPSFAIMNAYGENEELVHFDMYNAGGLSYLNSSGFYDYLNSSSIIICEWSENILSEIPENAVRVKIEKLDFNTDRRKITIEGMDL